MPRADAAVLERPAELALERRMGVADVIAEQRDDLRIKIPRHVVRRKVPPGAVISGMNGMSQADLT
jgi:hypothetical protein